MTNIEKIRSEMCECETDKAQLFGYIDCLESHLKEARSEIKMLQQKSAQFDRLKESFRKYRKKMGKHFQDEAGA